MRAGIADLLILKSAALRLLRLSARRISRRLPETRDRLLATSLTATWRYDAGVAYGPAWQAVRNTLLESFASHESESVQHTLHAMGKAVLDAVPEVAEIHIVMPNRHHLPVDVTLLRPRESQRGVRRDRGAVRPDPGDDTALVGARMTSLAVRSERVVLARRHAAPPPLQIRDGIIVAIAPHARPSCRR